MKNNLLFLHQLESVSELRVYRQGLKVATYTSVDHACREMAIKPKAVFRCLLGIQKEHSGLTFEASFENDKTNMLSTEMRDYLSQFIDTSQPETTAITNDNLTKVDYDDYVDHPIGFKVAGLAQFKVYKIDPNHINDRGQVKIFIKLFMDRRFTIHLSEDSTVLLAEGTLYDDDPTPLCNSQWTAKLRMKDVISEYISGTGQFKVRIVFSWFDGEQEPKAHISQCVPKRALAKYRNKTLIAVANCRTHKVHSMKQGIDNYKEDVSVKSRPTNPKKAPVKKLNWIQRNIKSLFRI